jgi:hypothetical protein
LTITVNHLDRNRVTARDRGVEGATEPLWRT